LQKTNDDLQAKLKEIEDKNLYLEAYSRRKNIIFENIQETTDKEDTEPVLRTFLKTELSYKDAHTVEIQRVHRLGKRRNEEKPRPIITRCLPNVWFHRKCNTLIIYAVQWLWSFVTGS